ncbi:MAG: DUF808 domain-containing protein [Lautropia sp.]
MASSLLALFDDIATLLDDVSVLTKVAAKKTAGVLGDDLAVNAEKVTGVAAERELPVVWAVFKGSLVNKAILVPAALALSAFAPWAIVPILMAGGAFLCYEGFEKVAHRLLHSRAEDEAHAAELAAAAGDDKVDLVAYEKDKIKGAIRTDFILSAEIIVITLGTVAGATLATRIGVLVGVALIMTVGVYGVVAGIVKLDDLGLHLTRRAGHRGASAAIGRAILWFAPVLMRFLSIAGTAAMFLVGGGILSHNVGLLHHWSEAATAWVGSSAAALAPIAPIVFDALVGMAAGAILLLVVTLALRVAGRGH